MERIKIRSLRSAELKKNEKKSRKKLIYIIIIAAGIVLAVLFIYKESHVTYHSFKIEEGATWATSSYNQYLPYKNGVLKYNKDGAEAIAANGTVIWNVPYNMKDPMADVCGSYAVIADRGGKTLIIINGSGTDNSLSLIHNISFVSISEQGMTAVISDNGYENMLDTYKPDSKDEKDTREYGYTHVLDSGFPLDIAISPDGKKSVIPYLQMKGDEISTWIVFYNYNKVGRSYLEMIVGGFDGKGFAARTSFIDSETVLVQKENGFHIYNIPENPTLTIDVSVENEILQMAYSSQMICLITKNNDEKGRIMVTCYNLKGKKLKEFYMQDRYDEVLTSGDDIIFYNKSSFCIFNRDGTIKMQGEMEKSYKYIYPLNNKDKYLLIGEGYMEILTLLTTKE